MFSLRQCLKDILQRFKSEKDYVVEQGESGIWAYRKWASGIAECWHINIQISTWTANGTSSFGYDFYSSIALPFVFTEIHNVYGITTTSTGIGCITALMSPTINVSAVKVHMSGNVNSSAIHHRLKVIGKWK